MGCPDCPSPLAGAVKLLQAEVGIGVSDSATIAKRRAVCEGCESWDHGRCRECGCYTWSKTSLKREACPKDKW